MVNPIPTGYHTVTPYLTVHEPEKLIEFLKAAFDAEIIEAIDSPDGVVHAETKVGNSMVMLGRANPQSSAYSAVLYVYVEDCDPVFHRAVQAGGEVVTELTDMPYGDRTGAVKDATGNTWWISTHKEDLTAEEIAKRMAERDQGG